MDKLQELKKKLEDIDGLIMYYECAESNYQYEKVNELNAKRRALVEEIREVEKSEGCI